MDKGDKHHLPISEEVSAAANKATNSSGTAWVTRSRASGRVGATPPIYKPGFAQEKLATSLQNLATTHHASHATDNPHGANSAAVKGPVKSAVGEGLPNPFRTLMAEHVEYTTEAHKKMQAALTESSEKVGHSLNRLKQAAAPTAQDNSQNQSQFSTAEVQVRARNRSAEIRTKLREQIGLPPTNRDEDERTTGTSDTKDPSVGLPPAKSQGRQSILGQVHTLKAKLLRNQQQKALSESKTSASAPVSAPPVRPEVSSFEGIQSIAGQHEHLLKEMTVHAGKFSEVTSQFASVGSSMKSLTSQLATANSLRTSAAAMARANNSGLTLTQPLGRGPLYRWLDADTCRWYDQRRCVATMQEAGLQMTWRGALQGTGGFTLRMEFTDIAVDSTGRVLAVGVSQGQSRGSCLTVARFLPDADTFDASFAPTTTSSAVSSSAAASTATTGDTAAASDDTSKATKADPTKETDAKSDKAASASSSATGGLSSASSSATGGLSTSLYGAQSRGSQVLMSADESQILVLGSGLDPSTTSMCGLLFALQPANGQPVASFGAADGSGLSRLTLSGYRSMVAVRMAVNPATGGIAVLLHALSTNTVSAGVFSLVLQLVPGTGVLDTSKPIITIGPSAATSTASDLIWLGTDLCWAPDNASLIVVGTVTSVTDSDPPFAFAAKYLANGSPDESFSASTVPTGTGSANSGVQLLMPETAVLSVAQRVICIGSTVYVLGNASRDYLGQVTFGFIAQLALAGSTAPASISVIECPQPMQSTCVASFAYNPSAQQFAVAGYALHDAEDLDTSELLMARVSVDGSVLAQNTVRMPARYYQAMTAVQYDVTNSRFVCAGAYQKAPSVFTRASCLLTTINTTDTTTTTDTIDTIDTTS